MDYENKRIPEGINVSDTHPLADFFVLTLGVGTFLVALVFALSFAAEWFIRYIPFSVEHSLVSSEFVAEMLQQDQDSDADREHSEYHDTHQKRQQYLQALANKLAEAQQLPEDMSITVHYADSNTVNAFATLGGNIIIHRGLIEKLPNENALAMVIAHEIAHIKHRDPIIALGRGLTIMIALMTVVGFEQNDMMQGLLGQVGLVTQLSFSRSQEVEADTAALKTLQAYYGHTQAAEALFQVLQIEASGLEPPAFLSTHPQTEHRIRAIRDFQATHGIDKAAHGLGQPATGKTAALPDFFRVKESARVAEPEP